MESKKKLLKKLAKDFLELNKRGIKDQYPINANYVLPNLVKYRQEIFKQVSKNYKKYPEIKLIQLTQLFLYREMDTPNKLFKKIINQLIKKRKDPSLKTSLELNKYKKNNLKEIKIKERDIKKYILYSELNTDILYPIFRGFGFNIYTKKNRFFKEYQLDGNKFMYSCKIIKKPKYLMTGHNLKEGRFKEYRFYGKLPKKPNFKEFKTDKQKIKYSVKRILKNLDVNSRVYEKDIILPKNIKSFSNNLTKKQNNDLINKTYKYMIKKIE